METTSVKPYIIVIGLLILTSLALAFTVNVTSSDQAGIKVELPDLVGTWQGSELRFCQNPVCQKVFLASQLENKDVCPNCGGKMGSMTLAEDDMLPPDTVVLKKIYNSPERDVIQASIVLSGRERASIHRPQMCLVGQGNEIVKEFVVSVPLEGREPLDVMVLETMTRRQLPDGSLFKQPRYYAYWFVGKGRETPYHVQRMIWMATDRIFRNVSHRWAYIAVAGNRSSENDQQYKEKITAFIHDLYPHMMLDPREKD